MKKNYQNPETEIVFVGLANLIMQEDPEMSDGEMGNQHNLASENEIFDENDIVNGSSNLWDN